MPKQQNRPHGTAGSQARLSIWVWLFIIGLIIPLFIYVGPLRLSVYRLVLLVIFFPALFFWLSGRAGSIRLPDICVLGICLWSTVSYSVVHGFAPMIETIGIFWVETLGAYLVGRCYIRTPEAFYSVIRLLFWLGILVLPFAIYEAMTDKNLILTVFGKIGPTYFPSNMDPRWGLDRVQGPFPHPIHFGVFFLSLSGAVYYVLGYGRRWIGRVTRMIFISFLGAGCLSSGPLVALIAQINIIIWDGVMNSVRQRWYILTGLSALGFIIVDMISNRTPFHVLATYLAFNAQTAYSRIWIFQWGTKNIFDNPIFGLGLNDWERSPYMTDSIDMFWIVGAIRHGIPVWILSLVLFFSIFLSVAFRSNLSERVNWYRTGYLVTMFGMFMAGWTVHYWDITYAFFMFLLASGVWILDWQGEEDGVQVRNSEPVVLGYTRFPAGGLSSTRTAGSHQTAVLEKGDA
ncbi:hypothetical protein SAMN05444414_1252 [Roseovarius marisflavi]|uniref:O-antigen ligase n=1 Tax=Roseovarius marisflavi TaxID=1054996 RepID=A0A1M7CF39_9RHOB|nr:hypothetical protein SAMN05444414_1252 [Roseovarius marisflavi]